MPNIVGVKFKEVGKVYYFSPKDIEFKLGDGVIVETARGVEFGTISVANSEVEDDKIVGELKSVIRKATEADVNRYHENLKRKPKALKDANERIAKHNLDMKLVDVEFTFDNSKVIFYFTSENRVDFRDLVKDLASLFKIRIELRQIGVRDECKLKGGLGPCGRPCCCNCYMGDFERVSIKMAKNQGLSLNPTKISGLCGKLMCCLKFEDEYYVETLKLMPKLNSEVTTPDGNGIVESNDMLKRTSSVRITLKNGDTELRVYPVDQLSKASSSQQKQATQDAADEIVETAEMEETEEVAELLD